MTYNKRTLLTITAVLVLISALLLVGLFPVDVLAVELDAPRDTAPFHEIVHAVETSDQGRFPASRGPYECSDLPVGNIHVYLLQRLLVTIEEVEVSDPDERGIRQQNTSRGRDCVILADCSDCYRAG